MGMAMFQYSFVCGYWNLNFRSFLHVMKDKFLIFSHLKMQKPFLAHSTTVIGSRPDVVHGP